jgi:cation diffusion facilitator family transporter
MVQPQPSARAAVPRRTALASIAAAGALVALKLGVGLLTGSLALISAGIESSGDVVAAILTFFAVRLGRQPADPEHPYGHARAENLGALGEAGILLGGGLIVAAAAINHLFNADGTPDTHWYVFAVIAVAVCVDLSRTVLSLRAARRYGSPALRSNAYHFGADMAGSVVVIVGLLLVRVGFAQGDAGAALVIAAIIFATATRLISENANVLMDRTPSEAREAAERALARLQPDIELTRLRLRESAGRYFADVIAAVAPGAAVVEGHQAANRIEAAIEAVLPGSDVVVHVEPRRKGLELRDRVLAIALAEPLVKEVHDITVYEESGSASVSLHLKFPADLDLPAVLVVAARVEQAIRGRPEVGDVQTHLEPLERPLRAGHREPGTDVDVTRAIGHIVVEVTGAAPHRVRLLPTAAGRIVFVTITVDARTSLVDAHQLGSTLEESLRRQLPDIADVVVGTETQAQ